MITFENVPRDWPFLNGAFIDWLARCVAHYGNAVGRVHYRFLGQDEILAANVRFLDHNWTTDIITFPYQTEGRLEADLLVGYEQVEQQAREEGVLLEQEARRVMVHGLLHCLGFNDQTEAERARMRAAEEYCLLLQAKKL